MDTSSGEQLARYRQLRSAERSLHHVLMKRLPRQAIEDSGELLGIYRDGALAFNSMDETLVLADYCIYDYRWDGKNVIERYVADNTIDLNSDEGVLLDAMLKARYSLFSVNEVVKGVGIQTRDLHRGDGGFIIDIGLSETAIKGFVFAGRIITPRGCRFSMTTGAALPADRDIVKRVADEIPRRFGTTTIDIERMSRARAAELSAFIIRIFLEGGASSRIKYEYPVAEAPARDKPKVGRNDPCPCGSGKKYKRCCGKA